MADGKKQSQEIAGTLRHHAKSSLPKESQNFGYLLEDIFSSTCGTSDPSVEADLV